MFDRLDLPFANLGGVMGTFDGAVDPAFRPDALELQPGRVLGLEGAPGSGLTRLGLSLLAAPARSGPVAFLDARGWLCPAAAWESGVPANRLIVIRCDDRVRWAQVTAALCEGVGALYAEVPGGVKETLLRRLGALARSRRTAVVLRPLQGTLPGGLAHLRLQARDVIWDGPDAGHGRLERRRLLLDVSGKGTGGMTRTYEVEDDGTQPMRVVPRLAAAAGPARAAG